MSMPAQSVLNSTPNGTKKNSRFFGPFKTKLTKSYKFLRAINIGRAHIKRGRVETGRITVMLLNQDDFFVEGSLSANGMLTGMTKLYEHLDLYSKSEIEFIIKYESDEPIVIITGHFEKNNIKRKTQEHRAVVSKKRNFRHIHLEPFRPGNLQYWEPHTETDIYLALGVLLEFTDYIYCSGLNSARLKKFAASYDDTSVPDAMLIYRATDEYYVCEVKMKSSDFKKNHSPDCVDVLICWHDDELQRGNLPHKVLCLKTIAKTKALAELEEY